ELEEFERKLEERERKEIELGRKLRGRKPLHPDNKKQKSQDGKQKKEVANTTDPDSRIMKTRRGFIQGYNPQLSVDSDTQIILAADLTQDHNDTQQLSPMLKQIIENTGKIPKHATADAGYDNEDQIDEFRERIDIYIPTQKDWKQRKAMREQPPPRGRIPNDLSKRERRERKLLTKKGKKIYKKRGSSVEPVIGQITSARGLSKLLLRGKEKGNSELKMYCIGHNLLKLWRHSMKVASC
ncbi:MAG: transposase, partial [Candidatus Heimdallarchaeota archaeon]|nr:transposase [Candidatus Heimdallarchaeota archaeon]